MTIRFKTTTKLDLPLPSLRFSNFLSLPLRFPSVIYDFHCSSYLRKNVECRDHQNQIRTKGKQRKSPLRTLYADNFEWNIDSRLLAARFLKASCCASISHASDWFTPPSIETFKKCDVLTANNVSEMTREPLSRQNKRNILLSKPFEVLRLFLYFLHVAVIWKGASTFWRRDECFFFFRYGMILLFFSDNLIERYSISLQLVTCNV